MKTKLLISIVAFLISFKCTEVKITKIVVKYIPFDTETFYSIKCNDFEDSFGSQIKTITITDQTILNKFNQFIVKLKPDKDNDKPDVRVKVRMYRNNGINDTLCISAFGVQLNGKAMILDKNFIKFILEIEATKR